MGVGTGRHMAEKPAPGGWAGWLLKRLRHARTGRQARLELVERIQLAPRQSLALVEADGQRFLVASSAEGSPAFYPVEAAARFRRPSGSPRAARASW